MKKIIQFLPVVFLIFLFHGDVLAAEKQIEIELSQDYNTCTFTLTFAKSGEYEAQMIAPNGTEYDCSKIDSNTMRCIVEKAAKGVWKAVITRVDNADMEFGTPDSPEDDDIGTVKVAAEVTRAGETNVVDNIKVGKDISGLSIYFKNDAIVATWTDINCGNVSVKVVNRDNNEIIKQSTVSQNERYFECELNNTVRNIVISVVPASSSRIEGAESSYEYLVDNHPNAIVTFPDVEYVNTETIKVDVVMNEDYGVYVENNDKKVLEEALMKAGEYSFDIPLNNTNNVVDFYIVDSEGNMRSTTKSFIKDTTPPTLSFDMAYDGLTTISNTYTISGSIMNYDDFQLNGVPYTNIATDGHFDIPCSLHLGVNEIILSASDKAGNVTTYAIYLTMVEEEEKSDLSELLPVIIVVAIIAVMVAVSIIKKRRKNQDMEEEEYEEEYEEESEDEYKDEMDEHETASFQIVDPVVEEKSMSNQSKVNRNNPVMLLDIEEDTESGGRKKKVVKRKKDNLKKQFVGWAVFCGVLLFIFQFVLSINYITSESMEPTIKTGDFSISYRLAYITDDVKKGDVIFFYSEETQQLMEKRVMGTPGDKIEFHDGYVYLNGQKLVESYLDPDVETHCVKSFEVPSDCIFVLGDNRENSADSRTWKFPYIAKSQIKGKVIYNFSLK